MNDDYSVSLDRKKEIDNEYLITQGTSLLFDQIERIRGFKTMHIKELILVVAKKNPKQEKYLRDILNNGFTYNGIHYSRFGKSASQGKVGITAFVSDDIFEELYMTTQMDIVIDECVYQNTRHKDVCLLVLVRLYIIICQILSLLENMRKH